MRMWVLNKYICIGYKKVVSSHRCVTYEKKIFLSHQAAPKYLSAYDVCVYKAGVVTKMLKNTTYLKGRACEEVG